MIQAQIMSGQIMSFDGSFEMKMPNQPQIVRMFKMPAMPFIMFHGPDIVHRFSTTPPPHSAKPNTWKSRMTASGDVDRQDERRKAQRPALLVQVVDLAVLAAPFHKAQGYEPEAPRQRGVGLHPVEPSSRAVLVAGCGGFGPHEQGERDRHKREPRASRTTV